MNLSFGLSAVAVYCVLHFGSISCQPLDTISEAELQRGLLGLNETMYDGLLLYSLAAVSSGTLDRTAIVARQSIREAAKHQANSTFHEQVELLCQILNAKMKAASVGFDKSKAAVRLPAPAKTYILQMAPGQNVERWLQTTPMPFDDAELIKLQIVLTLMNLRVSEADDKQRELVAAAKAVSLMAGGGVFKYTMDRVFKSVYDDFVANLLAQGVDKVNEDNIESHGAAFVQKLDQEFLRNVLLKVEYGNMKKELLESMPSKL